MSKSFIIKLPKAKHRNPLGVFQERKQIMKDRRDRRAKDARRQREPFEYGYTLVELIATVALFSVAAGLGFLAIHFITKFW